VKPHLSLFLLIILFLGANHAAVGEIIVFDLNDKPEIEAGNIYRLKIRPTPRHAEVFLDFHANWEAGASFPRITSITQSHGPELSVGDETGSLYIEVADYNLDGSLDFRFGAMHGTGGSWFTYYRWDGRRYVSWDEPENLGINSFNLKARAATARSRAGPSWEETDYHIRRGHFIKFSRTIFSQAQFQRELVPETIPDNDDVYIDEKYDGQRLKSRHILHGADARSAAEPQ
jgi:hypothetical protein